MADGWNHTAACRTLLESAPKLAPGARYLVCFSGGADSTALLDLMARAGLGPLLALHVDHGLQAAARGWALHCQEIGQTLGVPVQVLRVRIDPDDPHGPEAAARAARYRALRSMMRAGDVLVLAHHRDDQAETVVLRLMRGAGIDGLSAMRVLTPFAPGTLWRPFLAVSRRSLHQILQHSGLRWIEDPQNRDPRFTRVWLRRQLLPSMEARQPGVRSRLARLADHAAEQTELAADLAQIDLERVAQDETLDLDLLARLSERRQRNVLRGWLRWQGVAPPGLAVLARLQREVIAAAEDATPQLRLGACDVRRYRRRIHLVPQLPAPPDAQIRLLWTSAVLALPAGCGTLWAERVPPRALHVRFPRPGERLRPSESAHRHRLKHLFQSAGIPPWQRWRAPLIELDGEVAWLPGLPPSSAWRRFCAEHYWYPHYRAVRWLGDDVG